MSATSEIWSERHRLMRERSDEIGRRMKDYDEGYHAKMAALRERCAALGHGETRWHSNGWGGAFRDCLSCGARVETVTD